MADPIQLNARLQGLQGIGELRPAAPSSAEFKTIDVTGVGQLQGAGGPSFGDMVAGEIQKVNAAMNDSDQTITNLATGKTSDVHSAMIAMQKADLSFRMLLEVRNKVIRAYEEVMRTQT